MSDGVDLYVVQCPFCTDEVPIYMKPGRDDNHMEEHHIAGVPAVSCPLGGVHVNQLQQIMVKLELKRRKL